MSDRITIERETLERAIDALGPVGGSKARIATPAAGMAETTTTTTNGGA